MTEARRAPFTGPFRVVGTYVQDAEHSTVCDMHVGFCVTEATAEKRAQWICARLNASPSVDARAAAEEIAVFVTCMDAYEDPARYIEDIRAIIAKHIPTLNAKSIPADAREAFEKAYSQANAIMDLEGIAKHMWQAALAYQASAQQGVGEGWVLVPREPTEEMVIAGCRALDGAGAADAIMTAYLAGKRHTLARTKMRLRYAAMLSASPTIPASEGLTIDRYVLAKALAYRDGYLLKEINSTVGPPENSSNWRTYLGKADDLLAIISRLSKTDAVKEE